MPPQPLGHIAAASIPLNSHSLRHPTAGFICLEQVNFVGWAEPLQLLINPQGNISAFVPQPQAKSVDWVVEQRLTCPWDYVSLPGLDVQINGVLGLAFPELTDMESDLARLAAGCQFLQQQGINSFLPTIVTTSVAQIQTALTAFATFLQTPQSGAKILGIHLEGPFLHPVKRGAHPEQHLLPLTLDNVKRVLGDHASIVKLMTLAPELDPTGTVISYLREQGITVSLGHSQATAEQAHIAFDQGVTMLTHAFNAMPGLHHRQPGPLAAAITDPRVSYGLIADGQHVDPLMLELLIRTDRPGERGTFLVSDALAPLGLPDGVYPWDERKITVKAGTARLGDGTLSGTTLPLLRGVQNLVEWGICQPNQAIALATTAPRLAMGLPGVQVGDSVHELLAWNYDLDRQNLAWEWLSLEKLV